ncbi:beta strand repeat-containing protein [Aeoliella sp. SH292]|uniref:beta strand repeat-containing protein n=1 Tax=Aeoliella sp. SH292 TaxID=3454464 RepID=UPI003F9DC290
MSRLLAVGSITLLLLLASHADAVTLYQDSFNGSGGASLNGAAPDVSLGGANWASGVHLLDNGVQDGTGRFTALLPFTPEPGNVYTLSSTFSVPAGTTNNWLGVGFTELLAPANTGLDNRWLDDSNASRAALWALARTTGSSQKDQTFTGFAGGASGVAGAIDSSTAAATSVVITLDTTNPDWNVTWDFNGDGVDRTETITVAQRPNINFVGFSSTDTAGIAQITNFQVEGGTPSPRWTATGGGSFDTASSWLLNTVPTNSAVFGPSITAAATVTLDTPKSLNYLTFRDSDGYTLSGPSTLTMTGGAEIEATVGTQALSTQVAGTNGLTKTGAGTLLLTNAANNYTGNTNIRRGTLAVTALGALNQASGTIDVATGAVMQFTGNGLGAGASGNLTEVITGNGAVRFTGADPTVAGSLGLTTEVITASGDNGGFTGNIDIGGGTIVVTNPQFFGTSDLTDQRDTRVEGGQLTGTMVLSGINVASERLELAGRQPSNLDPHVSSTGNSTWGGPIVGITGGSEFSIESQAGSNLTLSGNITLPDSGDRNLNLSGAGNGRLTGAIVDRTLAPADGSEAANVNLVKSGTGTWTIATVPPGSSTEPPTSPRDAYHQGRTIVEQGTLAVEASLDESSTNNAGELWSRTIEVRQGATFNVSDFQSTYSLQVINDPDGTLSTGDETGQELAGAGTLQIGAGKTIAAYDDSSISPGDNGRGTLTINGNLSYSSFTAVGTGRLNFQLGNTTAGGDSDLLSVSGTAAFNQGTASDRIHVNVSPVEGTLAAGDYTLVQATGGVSGSATGGAASTAFTATLRDAMGNDITAGASQTFSVNTTGNAVRLNVAGATRNLNWAGTAGNAWDVEATNNWTGGATQFSHLDNVTFGNVANKSVTVSSNVAPGSVAFNGGAGSTYTLTGSGGLTGFGPVDVTSGTVQLRNKGNFYAGTTTVASGARLEMVPATVGSVVLNGTLSLASGASVTIVDDFNTPGLGEYTFTKGLDQGAGTTNISFSDVSGTIAATSTGTTGAEQMMGLRPVALNQGIELLIDVASATRINNGREMGIVVGETQVGLGNVAGDVRNQADHVFISINGTGIINSRGFVGGTEIATGNYTGRTFDTLFIKRLDNNNMELGFYNNGARTVLRTVTVPASELNLYNNLGVYADLRNDGGGWTGLDNLRLADVGGAGPVNVNGDFTMSATGTLELSLTTAGFTPLAVTGAATLSGLLDVSLGAGFTPFDGQQFTLLTATGGITGEFSSLDLPSRFSASIVNATSLVLTYALGLDGDFNGDGMVNLADYTVWRDNLGATEGELLAGNGNGGVIDASDYQLWKSNFGATSGAGTIAAGSSNVPEPGSMILLAGLAVGGVCVLRRRGMGQRPTA